MDKKQIAREKGKEAAKIAAKLLTPAQNYAIAVAGKNIKVGAFWGFVPYETVEEYYNQIKDDENMNIRPLGKDVCIVEVTPQYIIDSVLAVDNTLLKQEDIAHIEENLALAQVEFEKYLVNKGITDEYHNSVVAIYCTNQVTTLVNNNVAYPAYRLSLEHAMALMGAYGYQIRVGNDFYDVNEVANDDNLWKQLWESMVLSPTKTGVFIEIKATLPSEQYKEIRKQLKQATK